MQDRLELPLPLLHLLRRPRESRHGSDQATGEGHQMLHRADPLLTFPCVRFPFHPFCGGFCDPFAPLADPFVIILDD